MWSFVAVAAFAADTEIRVDAGGEFGPQGVGVFDAGVRHGPWSLALQTDTVDGRYSPEFGHGRAWVGVRVATFAAGLLLVPWNDGVPDADHKQFAGYAGPDAGILRYLPDGFYVGAQAGVHVWWFYGESPDRLPTTPVGTADAVFGWYRPFAAAEAQAGADVEPGRISPHARVSAEIVRPRGFSPYVAVHAGWAVGEDALTLTRLGGLSPYVVPFAGAAIAEYRVEDYAVGRLGPSFATADVRVSAFADVAWADGRRDVGFGAAAHGQHGPWFADIALGYSPWLVGVHSLDAWVLVGWDHKSVAHK